MRFALVFFCLWLATSNGQGRGRGRGHDGKASEPAPAASADIRFASSDITLIRQYYSAHPVTLPPGLEKKVGRGKPLPPGWQKKLQGFPSDIDGRLPPPCAYCARGVVDGYGVIYDKRTSVILDFVQLVGNIAR